MISSRSNGLTGQNGGSVQPEWIGGGGQTQRVQSELAVGAVCVESAGGDPDGPSRRGDPRSFVRRDGQHPAPGVDDLVVVVPVRVDLFPGRESQGAGGSDRRVADFQHYRPVYWKSDSRRSALPGCGKKVIYSGGATS
jgi:hypothetical protein